MTLTELIRAVEGKAKEQPSINTIVPNDIFTLNTLPDVAYGVFAWTQGQHQYDTTTGVYRYSLVLFYVDRLTENEGNRLEVQSVGIQTLGNIIQGLEEKGIYTENDCTFTTFNQRFTDECAGVFCNVIFDVPAEDVCGEDYTGMTDATAWEGEDVKRRAR